MSWLVAGRIGRAVVVETPVSMATWIVVPTYNERQNLEPLLSELFCYDAVVLLVDDNSPDGTGQAAEQLRSRWPGLQVLHRQYKTGLSDAYRAGLHYAIDHGATIIVHCDADRSHDSKILPQLLAGLEQADVVVASRYVPGGRLAIPWSRRVISLAGNWYMRLLLGRAVHDWSSGYKAWRAETLATVLAQPWTSTGYACLIEMSWLAKQAGARFAEVPLVFHDRQVGDSKFSWAIMLEDLRFPWRLRRRALSKG